MSVITLRASLLVCCCSTFHKNCSDRSFSRSFEPRHNPSAQAVSAVPLASSTYAQFYPQTGQHPVTNFEGRTASPTCSDISPPDSPANFYGRRDSQGSPDVSPVDASPETPNSYIPPSSRYNSNVPTSRKTSHGARTFLSALRGKNEVSEPSERDSTLTRWDDFSGEPTTSENGKPAQATLGNAPFDSPFNGIPTDLGYGNHISIRGGPMDSHAPAQKTLLAERNYLGGREDRKGPSGRSNLVSPWVERLRPAVKSTGVAGRLIGSSSPTQDRPAVDTTPYSVFDRTIQPLKMSAPNPYDHDDIIKPIVPLKVGRNSPPRIITTPSAQHHERSYPSPAASETRSPAAWSLGSETSRNKPLPTPAQFKPNNHRCEEPNGSNEHEFLAAINDMDLSDQPGSRFSATTYATTTYESPPDTPRMDSETPMPTLPTPLMNRKRPVPGGGVSSAKSTVRKPTPLERGTSPKDDRFSKTLPQSPAEKESVGRIASLQASLDNLHRRRINLQTVIRELTQVVQPSSAAYDMASREEIKRSVKGLNTELAGVMKEEHEVGMKLHRAYKKRDKDDIWEPTGLWVRRVTN